MHRPLKSVPLFGILITGLIAAGSPAAIPEIRVEGPIVSEAGSRPWNASIDRIDPLDVDALGYTEEEYLISGTANVYDWGPDGKPVVKATDARYVTRILVRKPKHPASFSGTVWFNPSNPTLGVDMDGLWGCCSGFLSRRGDAVVNITFKPISMRALKAVNGQRYKRLTMPNPVRPDLRCDVDKIVTLDTSMHYISEQEDGLAWDMFAQVANLIKSNRSPSPLAGYRVSRVYGYGYSQDANYLRTFLNDFHSNAQVLYGQSSPFDGFLLVAGTRTVPINQCSTRSDHTKTKGSAAPVITASTEADANPRLPGLPDGRSAWRPDSDALDDRYRHYDLAGTVHVGTATYRTMPSPRVIGDLQLAAPQAARAISQIAGAQKREILEIQQYIFLTAMMRNLDLWSREKRAPPPGSRFETGPDGNVLLDVNGNAASGLRSPDITVPVASFALRGPATPPLGFLNYTYVPFRPEKLRALYPTHASYVQRVRVEAAKLLRARIITNEGFAEFVDAARKRPVP